MLADPDAKARFAALGVEPEPMSRGELDGYLKKKVAKWATMIKASGVNPN